MAFTGAKVLDERKTREAGWCLDLHPINRIRIRQAQSELTAGGKFGYYGRRYKNLAGECGKKMEKPDLVEVLEGRGVSDDLRQDESLA